MESEGGVLGEEKMISVSANNALRLMFWMRGPLRQQSKQIAYTLMKMCSFAYCSNCASIRLKVVWIIRKAIYASLNLFFKSCRMSITWYKIVPIYTRYNPD
jgi:hypothetical protein